MKKSYLNEVFDKVVCINLLDRVDKKNFMQTQFDKFNINAEWFTAIKYGFAPTLAKLITISKNGFFNINQPNEIGCALSHYTVIKTALQENRKNLFIFEDDAHMHKNFNEKFKTFFNKLPENWDMFLLYSYITPSYHPVNINNPYWFKAYQNWSNVAIGMNKNFMEQYIQFMDNYFCVADMPTFKLQSKLNCYLAKEFLVIPSEHLVSDVRVIENYKIYQQCNIDKNNFI